MSFQSYIDSKIPHLRALHTLLGLGTDELQADLTRIDEQIRKAIDGVVFDRERKVEELKREVEALKARIGQVYMAMGELDVDARRSDTHPLPQQITDHQSRISSAMARHRSLLSHLRTQQLALLDLTDFLGPEFEIPGAMLEDVLGGLGSLHQLRGWDRAGGVAGNDYPTRIEDVGARRCSVVQQAIELAREAKASRSIMLLDRLEDIRYLIGELSLIPPSSAFDEQALLLALRPHLPEYYTAYGRSPVFDRASPDADTPESSTSLSAHQAILIRYLQCYPPPIEDSTGFLTSSVPGTLLLPSTISHPAPLSLEPTFSFLSYLSSVLEIWQAEKSRRRDRIQGLYGELEAIYRRLEGDEGEMMQELRAFVEGNCGLSLQSIEAYEKKLEVAKVLRKTNVASYIEAARKDIELLWDLLLYGPESMALFQAYNVDDFTDVCLDEHEQYMEALSLEQDEKGALLGKARQWVEMRQQETELVEKENGPDRYNTRGGALLQLQKARKRIDTLKPKLETALLDAVPAWEERHGRPFLVDDCRLVDVITEDRAEQAAKKGSRKAAPGITPGRSTAAKVTQTPGTMAQSKTPSAGLSQSQSRKREAPSTATPTAKRARTDPGQTSSPLSSKSRNLPGTVGTRPAPPKTNRPTIVALGMSTAINHDHPISGNDSAIEFVGSLAVSSVLKAQGRRMSFKPSAQPRRDFGPGACLGVMEEDEADG